MKKKNITPYLLLLITLAISMMFAVLEPTFLKVANIMNILGATVVLCIASLGEAMVLITGEVDFACGAELATGGCLITILTINHVPYLLGIVITLSWCALLGVINGFFHTKIGVPAFIATMGMSFVIDGVTKLFTDNAAVYAKTKIFKMLGQGRIAGIPLSVIALAVIAVVAFMYTESMTSGRRLYAVGANGEACRYVGINPKKEKMKSFVICAMLCGFAGIINSSQISSANPGMGDTVLSNVLTNLMLGASFYRLGVFNVPGTIVGAVLINVITNGMVLMGAATWQQHLVKGLIMITAVTLITLGRANATRKIARI